jgi:hypothetical protein
MGFEPRRSRPLPVQVGNVHIVLTAADVNRLTDAISQLAAEMRKSHLQSDQAPTVEALRGHLADLDELRGVLASASGSLAGPPFEITREQARLLRTVLADVTGYQRGELTAALRELRQILTE